MFEGGKCELGRRGFVFKGIFAAGASVIAPSEAAQPSQGQSIELCEWNACKFQDCIANARAFVSEFEILFLEFTT